MAAVKQVEQDTHGGSIVDSGRKELTAQEIEMLELENLWWKYSGAKEQAIREKFDMSATRYYQLLNALIDTEAALAQEPLLVKRLRRLRSQRQRQRQATRVKSDR